MIDRDFQRALLEELEKSFPTGIYLDDAFIESKGWDKETVVANTAYLAMHGLLTSGMKLQEYVGSAEAEWFAEGRACLTERGIDFLAQDGGLSAILGVVTIKLHDDSIKQLLQTKVLGAADIPKDEKERMLEAIRDLPAESTKHVAMQMIDKAIEATPQALEWLRQFLS